MTDGTVSRYRKASWRLRQRGGMLRVAARRPTAARRALPDFLVIGAMRGGTSSLFRYLGAHPAVTASLRKEVEYFTLHHARGPGWYRAHFPLAQTGRSQAEPSQTFEATPYYLFHPRAAERAAELVPHAKIIALLRDPVDRALSHYRHMVRVGLEPLELEAALAREEDRIAGEEQRMIEDGAYVSLAHHRYSYVARGRYAEQLRRWLDRFPREQVLALASEDLYADPQAAYRTILAFLGLPEWQPSAFANHSATGAARSAHGDDEEAVRRKLAAEFAPHNERLAALLGRDFAWQAP